MGLRMYVDLPSELMTHIFFNDWVTTEFYTLPYDAPDLPPAPLRYLGIPGLIPSVEGLSVSTKVVSEYLLSVFYFLRGWISPFRL